MHVSCRALLRSMRTVGRLRVRGAKALQTAQTRLSWRLALRAFAVTYIVLLAAAIVFYKALFVRMIFFDPYFTLYGMVVSGYILSRFGVSVFYRPSPFRAHEPSVAIVMPAFNEEEAIERSIRSLLSVDYPPEKIEVVVVDDGSLDRTGPIIDAIAASDSRVQVIHFEQNRGKRAAMAAGIRATSAEIVCFVDSDSVLERDAMSWVVQDFTDPRVGAVAGRAEVLNHSETWVTRMQAVRYTVAFQVMKAAESVFGCVTCCSGCFAAYRRSAIVEHLSAWEEQRFLGCQATFGDDRSLTNYVLRRYRVVYQSRAISATIVPHTVPKFLRQQMRWKRSWARESLIVGRFIWKKHPLAAVATYVGILLPLIAPVTVVRAMLWRPFVEHRELPLQYLLGIYAMALVYGLYYEATFGRHDGLWLFGVLFVFFYLCFLVWQTYAAIVTARTSTWGTRPSVHASEPSEGAMEGAGAG
jgi:hyaluronan synthase